MVLWLQQQTRSSSQWWSGRSTTPHDVLNLRSPIWLQFQRGAFRPPGLVGWIDMGQLDIMQHTWHVVVWRWTPRFWCTSFCSWSIETIHCIYEQTRHEVCDTWQGWHCSENGLQCISNSLCFRSNRLSPKYRTNSGNVTSLPRDRDSFDGFDRYFLITSRPGQQYDADNTQGMQYVWRWDVTFVVSRWNLSVKILLAKNRKYQCKMFPFMYV